MLDVRRLRVFKEVAERGSFSAAADALSFTQSAVSQQIAALERETGTTLLQRGPGGIRLTDAGRALVTHTEVVLERLTEAEPEDSLPRLRRGEFEVALIYDYGLDESLTDGVDLVQLLDDPLYLVLPPDHPLAGRRSIKIEDLADEPWVSGCRDGHCHEMLMRTCQNAGFEPNLAFFTNDTQVQIALVAAGVGVTLAPELGLRNVAHEIAVRAVAPQEPARRVLAAVPSADYCSPATEAMTAVLKEVAADFPAAAERTV